MSTLALQNVPDLQPLVPSGLMERVKHWLVYMAGRGIICFLQTLSPESCQTVAHILAFVMCRVLRVRHDVVDENLRHALPQLSADQRVQLEQRMWAHLVMLTYEISMAPRVIHNTNWRRYIHIPGKEILVQALLSPRPLVAVAGHFGNFEVAGYLSGLLGFPTFTVARPIDNPHLHRFIDRQRRATGQYILPNQGIAEYAKRVLEAGEVLALLGDHYAGRKGCWVTFFGRPASCHKAVALFSLASQCPLLVLYARRLGRPLQFELSFAGITDPLTPGNRLTTVPELTQWYNRLLEQVIRRDPDQYWWLHRRWKDPRRQKNDHAPTEGSSRTLRMDPDPVGIPNPHTPTATSSLDSVSSVSQL